MHPSTIAKHAVSTTHNYKKSFLVRSFKKKNRIKVRELNQAFTTADFVVNAQGGVRLTQAYRNKVNTIHHKLTINEKIWLALLRNKPN